MDEKGFRFWLRLRSRDLIVGLFAYLLTTVLLVGFLAFGYPYVREILALQIAFAAVAVALGVMTWLWIDGAIDDLKALVNDVPESEEDSAIVGKFRKTPFPLFRILTFVLTLATTAGFLYAIFATL